MKTMSLKKVTFVQQFGAVFRQLEHPLIDLSRDHDGTSCTVIHQNLSQAERWHLRSS